MINKALNKALFLEGGYVREGCRLTGGHNLFQVPQKIHGKSLSLLTEVKYSKALQYLPNKFKQPTMVLVTRSIIALLKLQTAPPQNNMFWDDSIFPFGFFFGLFSGANLAPETRAVPIRSEPSDTAAAVQGRPKPRNTFTELLPGGGRKTKTGKVVGCWNPMDPSSC